MKVTQLWLTLCDPMDYTVLGILQPRILEWIAFPYSRGSSQPRDRTQVSHIAGGFFTSWATRKPNNTGVGSLSLLQGIFSTKELNHGFLHYRQITYQLNIREAHLTPNSLPILTLTSWKKRSEKIAENIPFSRISLSYNLQRTWNKPLRHQPVDIISEGSLTWHKSCQINGIRKFANQMVHYLWYYTCK